MDDKLFEEGPTKRKAALGVEYVETNLAAADESTRLFQGTMMAWGWGFGLADERINTQTRAMNLARRGDLGKTDEWETHSRGARVGWQVLEEKGELDPSAIQ